MSFKYDYDEEDHNVYSRTSIQSNENNNDWCNLKHVYNNNRSISTDNDFQDDDYNVKKVNNLINEFIKLNDHLKSESNLFDELENGFYFSSEQKIIDFINNDLKVCLAVRLLIN